MSYTPINLIMYTAAYEGALAAMTAYMRSPNSQSAGDYVNPATAAGMWAQEFDVQWNSAVAGDMLQVGLAWSLSEGIWNGKSPAALTLLQIQNQVLAVIAIITEAELYFAGQGITPPPWGGGSGGTGLGIVITGAGNVVSATYGRYYADTSGGDVTLQVGNGVDNQPLLAEVAVGVGKLTLTTVGGANTLLYNGVYTNTVQLQGTGAAASWNWVDPLKRWS